MGNFVNFSSPLYGYSGDCGEEKLTAFHATRWPWFTYLFLLRWC